MREYRRRSLLSEAYVGSLRILTEGIVGRGKEQNEDVRATFHFSTEEEAVYHSPGPSQRRVYPAREIDIRT